MHIHIPAKEVLYCAQNAGDFCAHTHSSEGSSVLLHRTLGTFVHIHIPAKEVLDCCTELWGLLCTYTFQRRKFFIVAQNAGGNYHRLIADRARSSTLHTSQGTHTHNHHSQGVFCVSCTERWGENTPKHRSQGKRLSMLHRTLGKQ